MHDENDNNFDEQSEERKVGKKEKNYARVRTTTGYCVVLNGETGEHFHCTDDEVRKAFLLYAIGKLTMENTAIEMGWTRRQFYALKTSFNITKDTVLPFTPEYIDVNDVNDLVEEIRIFKKQVAIKRIKYSKDRDQKREINRMNKTKFWFDEVLEKIEPIPQGPIFITPNYDKSEPDLQYKVDISDIHNGLKVDSVFNQNNMEETDRRMRFIADWIIENIPRNRTLLLCDKGDIVHGLIHGSTEKYSDPVVIATSRICMAYRELVKRLLDAGFRIKFGKVNGNHASVEKAKKNRTDEENFGNILPMVLKASFMGDDRFEMLEKVQGLVHTVMVTDWGHGIMLAHGDEAKDTKLVDKALAIMRTEEYEDIKIIEISCGHIHHYKAEQINSVLVEYSEAVCGTDQYASGLGYHQKPAFRVTVYDKNGRVCTRGVIIKSRKEVYREANKV